MDTACGSSTDCGGMEVGCRGAMVRGLCTSAESANEHWEPGCERHHTSHNDCARGGVPMSSESRGAIQNDCAHGVRLEGSANEHLRVGIRGARVTI
jgi:hypothetical protein